MPVEELRGLIDDRRRVEELVGRKTGDRAARDVAHGVAAGAGRSEAGRVELVEDLRQRRELQPVELDVLPRGELAVAAAEPVRDRPDRAQLRRAEQAARQLDPE